MAEIYEDQTGSSPRMSGRWLVLFRSLWLAMALYTVGLIVVSLPEYFEHNQIMNSIGATAISLMCLLVSVLIFWRKSSDRMALLTAFALLGLSGAILIGSDAPLLGTNPIWTWLYTGYSVVGGSLLFLFFYLFPDGSFVPRWTRLMVPLVILFNLASIFRWEVGPMPLLFLGGGFAIQVYRYRRVSTPLQRLQTKWVVYGLSLGIAFLIVGIGSYNSLPEIAAAYGLVADLLIFLGFLLIPLSIGVAILRSHLWDIDVIIRRTLVYGALSATLALVFFGSVTLLQSLFVAISGQRSAVATVISTLVIAALFNPLRKRIQNDIDRRFFRRKYDAEKVVAAFSASLREDVDLDNLQAQLVAVVEETLQPEHVSLWMKKVPKR